MHVLSLCCLCVGSVACLCLHVYLACVQCASVSQKGPNCQGCHFRDLKELAPKEYSF